MERVYRIIGNNKEGEYVKLVLDVDVVKENPSVMEGLTNIGGLRDKITYQTKRIQDPDQIRIPLDEWEKMKYNINDLVSIKLERG